MDFSIKEGDAGDKGLPSAEPRELALEKKARTLRLGGRATDCPLRTSALSAPLRQQSPCLRGDVRVGIGS